MGFAVNSAAACQLLGFCVQQNGGRAFNFIKTISVVTTQKKGRCYG
jgi:hypothetical protein